MKKSITIILIIFFVCNIDGYTQVNKGYSNDYVITIETRGCLPGSSRVKATLYGTMQSQIEGIIDFLPNHLYITKQEFINDSVVSGTYDLELNDTVEDSIFKCVYRYLEKFPIKEKLNKPFVWDGGCLSVELQYERQMIRCEEYNLKNANSASPAMNELLEIINRRVPKKFQM